MQRLIAHGSQIDQKPEVVLGIKLCHINERLFVIFRFEEAISFFPKVLALYSVVVQHVGRAVHCDADFHEVGENVLF